MSRYNLRSLGSKRRHSIDELQLEESAATCVQGISPRSHPIEDAGSNGSSPTASSCSSPCADACDTCFICLASEQESGKPLCQPCSCPRKVHEACMARWQLQSAGREEERTCRFCKDVLPDWRTSLLPAPKLPATSSGGEHPGPVMVVTLGNQVHRIHVKPGPEGMVAFQARIRELFSIPDSCDFDVSFRCRAPALAAVGTSDTIQLEGMNSFDAATHCASLMAAQRAAVKAAQRAAQSPRSASAARRRRSSTAAAATAATAARS